MNDNVLKCEGTQQWLYHATEYKTFKSPLRVVVAFLGRSRESLRGRLEHLAEQTKQLIEQQRLAAQRIEQQQRQINELKQQLSEAEKERDRAQHSVNLLPDPPVTTHGYGARTISLAVNLAQSVGLRGAERALKLFFEWLGLADKTPSRTAIRSWMQRLGVAELNKDGESSEDLITMSDHSIQIGTEKVLVVLGLNASAMPEQGKALTHEDVRVLHIEVGSQWKTADVEKANQALVEKHGAPRLALSDGAIELREGANCFQTVRSDALVLGDLKHHAANVLKSVIGHDTRFKEVSSKIGATRSAIQQTELAHLTPPTARPKARFMNLGPTIAWMTLIVWLLKTPDAKARSGIDEQRLVDKLGWVAEYANEIVVWQECQEVVSMSLALLNTQHLYRGAADALSQHLRATHQHPKSHDVAQRLIDFVRSAEQQLNEGERVPLSTEILESVFGLYKQLEGQQSRSSYTSLLACLPALLKSATPESVRTAFQKTSHKDVTQWVKNNFASTVTSRRQAAIQEHKHSHKRATTQPTTT